MIQNKRWHYSVYRRLSINSLSGLSYELPVLCKKKKEFLEYDSKLLQIVKLRFCRSKECGITLHFFLFFTKRLTDIQNRSIVRTRVISQINMLKTFSWSIGRCQKNTKNNTKILNINVLSAGGARGVMVIVVGNGHGDTSSKPGRDWLHFT